MKISHRQFTIVVWTLGFLALAMLPFWPYSQWGYFPSGLCLTAVGLMFALKRLAQD